MLGQLVADLKYKRVYLTSAEALAKAPVWQRESTLRPVHAVEIAEAKYFKKDVVSFALQMCNSDSARLFMYGMRRQSASWTKDLGWSQLVTTECSPCNLHILWLSCLLRLLPL